MDKPTVTAGYNFVDKLVVINSYNIYICTVYEKTRHMGSARYWRNARF